jgi:hypothetical protein
MIRSGNDVGAVLRDRTPTIGGSITDLLPSERLVVFRHLPRRRLSIRFSICLSMQERLLKEISLKKPPNLERNAWYRISEKLPNTQREV